MKKSTCLFATFLAALFFAPAFAFAATNVSGTLASDTTWTASSSPYLISALGFTVPAGTTLTVEPGVVVKASQSNTPLIVDGTINAQGTASSPVYFTSLNDSTVGGDTGFSPSGSSWAGITANSGAIIHLDHAVIRNGNIGIANRGGAVTVSNSAIANSVNNGISHASGATAIASSTISGNAYGIYAQGIGAISFSGNTFSDNRFSVAYFDLSDGLTFANSGNTESGTRGNGIFLYGSGENISNQTLSGETIPYVITVFGVNVPATKTLTVEQGAIIKFAQSNASLTVNGTLNMRGTAANPVYVTSFADDTLGGDTDGTPYQPQSQWGTITVNSGATANFTHAILRNGGIVSNNGGTITVSNSTIADSTGNGLSHSAGTTNIASSTFSGNSYGLYALGTGAISLTNNTFAERGGSGYFDLSSGLTLANSGNIATGRRGFFLYSDGSNSSNQTWSGDGIPYIVTVFGVTVPAGKTLTVKPGAVIKFVQNNASFGVKGTLDVQGTASNPVYFTSFNDSTIGGDTGFSSFGFSWPGITINSGATANFTHAILRNGGYFSAAISNNGGNLVVSNSTVADNFGNGISHANGTTTVSQSSIRDNAGYGIINNTTAMVNAKNNWWGRATGPRHASNLAGTGNAVSDFVDFAPWLSYDPTVTAPVTLSNPTETEDDNNQDAKGVANKTVFTFGVTASGAPDTVNLIATSETGTTTTLPLSTRTTLGEYMAASTFPKGRYTYHFETNGGIRTPDAHFTAGYSNVAFLPGLEASRLYTQGAFFENQLWEPNRNDDVRKLYLRTDGTSVNSGIYTRDILNEKNVSPVGQGNIYKSFMDSMNGMKNAHVINDWKPLPYDWRFDVRDIVDHPIALATTSYSMVDEIQKLAAGSDTGKVTIIAHSNGGLVAKVLADKLGADAPKILDQMIFVAVPEAGTPQAIGVILHGFDQGLPFDSIPLILTPETARGLAVNMPSAYGLLPSAQYFTYVDAPIVSFDNNPILAPWRAKYGVEIHSAERLHNFLADQARPTIAVTDPLVFPASGNEPLLNRAEILHGTLDNWTPPAGVTLTQIAGWGEDTLKSIVYYQGVKGGCETAGGIKTCGTSLALEYKPKMVLDGDGTVVVPSALWTPGAGKYWVDLRDYNKWWINGNIPRKHADILEVSQLLTFIQNLITRNGGIPNKYITTTTPPNDNPATRLRFTLHSPLTLDLYDNLGNHTGISTTGTLEENIPGTRYLTFGEVKYISAPASTTLHLVMNGYATGSFTLDMEEVKGDTVTASTTFAGIPSATSTTATIDIPQGNIASSSPLFVDTNGDGATDFFLTPKQGGVVLPDFTPPEVVIAFSATTNDIVITGKDTGGKTTVQTSATSTTISDEAGNTLVIPFLKYKEKSMKLKIVFDTLIYNGVATTTPKTTLEYEWELKNGTIKELKQDVRIKNTRRVSAEYELKKNETKITDKVREDGEKSTTKSTKLGIVPIVLSTQNGVIAITY